MTRLTTLLAGVLLLLPAGCKKSPPAIVAASGVVTLNGKPLDKVTVTFYPLQEGLDGGFQAVAVTDDDGKFTLVTAGKDGAAACAHRVVISEGPAPKEARGESERSQIAAGEYLRTLKNRPIPKPYLTVADTPLTITITGPQSDLKIELTGT
jgi:hypothetical protein